MLPFFKWRKILKNTHEMKDCADKNTCHFACYDIELMYDSVFQRLTDGVQKKKRLFFWKRVDSVCTERDRSALFHL